MGKRNKKSKKGLKYKKPYTGPFPQNKSEALHYVRRNMSTSESSSTYDHEDILLKTTNIKVENSDVSLRMNNQNYTDLEQIEAQTIRPDVQAIDKTDSSLNENKIITIKEGDRPSKSDKKKKKNPFKNFIVQLIVSIISGLIILALGYLVFDHHARLAKTEKETENQKELINKNSNKIDLHDEEINGIKNRQNIIEYKVDQKK